MTRELEVSQMPRFLRMFVLGCIAITFAYLLLHAREPLRLNIGDPWSDANVLSSINYVKDYGFLETSFTDILDVGPLTEDSYRYIHYPPLSEIIYGAIGRYLGVSDIGTYRLFGIGFSALAMWLLFLYARRMWSDSIALIATALFTTSLFWMQYADSMHQAPVMQASGFLALWGLVRAIDTGLRRHYAAAIIGSFACFLTSYDYWLFLPAAVLFTVYIKLGNPFARGNRHFVVLCAAGCALGIVAKCMAVIGAVGWPEFVADLHLQFLERATSTHDRKFSDPMATLIRRFTFVFTPLAWITAGYHAWKALRAPNLTTALKDTALWMLIVAAMFLYIFRQLAASQMLASQVLLPFYAIGSAVVIERLLAGRKLLRGLAVAWLVFAPAWSFYFMLTHPRSVLDRDDVAKVNAYMARSDRNDFMMSNLMSDGHIQASFQRHYWAALDADDTSQAHLQMLRILDLTGTDYLHAAIFTEPNSRFIDKSLWPLAMPRRLWSVTGWPHMYRRKANHIIREYDRFVMKNITAVKATKLFDLSNFTLYRVDRGALMKLAEQRVPLATLIDFGSLSSTKFKLRGWSEPYLTEQEGLGVSTMTGFYQCPLPFATSTATQPARNACATVLTKLGLKLKHDEFVPRAQLMIRTERSCDLRLTFTFRAPSLVALTINDFTSPQHAPSTEATFVVPQRSVRAGVNVLTLDHLLGRMSQLPDVATLAIVPVCSP